MILKATPRNMARARAVFGDQVRVTDDHVGVIDLSSDPADYPDLGQDERVRDGEGTRYVLAAGELWPLTETHLAR